MIQKLLTDDVLKQKAFALLEEQLGPVEALRFLALVRREPFDYQAYRDKEFSGMSVQKLFLRMQKAEARTY